ncbi:hypothetical protein FACS1894103_2590 [Campylobacterota bacterium]|nr:hypothetical protein FACS1894103_2590 [Campylobacterota bacterium]
MSLHKALVALAVFCSFGTAAFADADLIDDLIVKVGAGSTNVTGKADGESKNKNDLAYQVGLGYRFSEKGQLVVDYTAATIGGLSDAKVSTISAELDYLFLDYSWFFRPFVGLGYGLTTVSVHGESGNGDGVFATAGAFVEISQFLAGVKYNFHAAKIDAGDDVSFENPNTILFFAGYRF